MWVYMRDYMSSSTVPVDWNTIWKKDLINIDWYISKTKSPSDVDLIWYTPVYGNYDNWIISAWTTSSTVPNQMVTYSTYNPDWTVKDSVVLRWSNTSSPGSCLDGDLSSALFRKDFWLILSEAAYRMHLCFNAKEGINFYFSPDNYFRDINPYAISNDGRYVYAVWTWTANHSYWVATRFARYDTKEKKVDWLWDLWSGHTYNNYIWIFETKDEARIYASDYSWWETAQSYLKINKNTHEVEKISVTASEFSTVKSKTQWMYDNFNDWNLLINYNWTNWTFWWVSVWTWYFKRWWDNEYKEYVFSPSRI